MSIEEGYFLRKAVTVKKYLNIKTLQILEFSFHPFHLVRNPWHPEFPDIDLNGFDALVVSKLLEVRQHLLNVFKIIIFLFIT